MRSLHDFSIKQKLRAITMLTVIVSLAVAGTGIIISDALLFISAMERDLAALAQIVSDNSTASLEFDDPDVANATLQALAARPHIVAACIYRQNGMLFARYSRDPGNDCAGPDGPEGTRFTLRALIASHPITLKNERIGILLLHYDLGEAVQRVTFNSEIVLLILLASSLVAFLLSSRLQEIIAAPLSQLASAAATVSRTGDYSLRVAKTTSDELGVLVDAFNEMLGQVQLHDRQVQNARYSLQTTLTSIGDGVISTDTSGNVVFANPAAQLLLEKSQVDLVGADVREVIRIVDEVTREEIESPIQRVLRSGLIVGPSDRALLITDGGKECPIDDSAAPIRDSGGELTGAVLIFRDISGRRATEKLLETQATELRQRAEALKAADERKDQFLAMLAHELRNPLAPIRNAAEVLKRIGMPHIKEKTAIEVIERQARHLTHLVDDLLDVSRITRGKVTLQQETLELCAIVDAAIEISRPLIQLRKHKLTLVRSQDLVYVNGDLTRLAQVISNLLNNAAKFTDPGGEIIIETLRKHNEAIIRVIDNGIGLSPSLIPYVFDLFAQADRTLDRSQGGLGVGLTLAKTLVEMHGGVVEAKSAGPGQGSEFTVKLPAVSVVAIASKEASSETSFSVGPRRRILIVEDNSDAAEMLSVMLKLDGHVVRITLEGTEALQAAREFRPDAILCDIGLPGMDGYQVAAHLREQPEFAKTLLIAVSGYGREEDRVHSRQAGFHFHLTKPVDHRRLSELLRSVGMPQ
jgi:PAS domain S-box-containing protein